VEAPDGASPPGRLVRNAHARIKALSAIQPPPRDCPMLKRYQCSFLFRKRSDHDSIFAVIDAGATVPAHVRRCPSEASISNGRSAMQPIESQSQDRTIHLVSLVGSLVLFMSPWVLGYSATTAAVWSAWASGIVIAVISLIALLQLYEWEEWVNGAVGLWAVAAPFVFGFTSDRAATFAHISVGGAIVALSAYEVFRMHHVGVQTAP
jgi:hypothetical protein